MSRIYSLYDAKVRFSQVIREVRDGETVTVSYRGEPVAEIRPISRVEPVSLEQRIEELKRRGEIIEPENPHFNLEPSADISGALERFLEERDDYVR